MQVKAMLSAAILSSAFGLSTVRRNTVIAGNLVGTNASGTAAVGNASDGIRIEGASGTRVGTNADGVSDSLERNTIAGNSSTGVLISGATTTNTVVAGNYIGTDVTGASAIGNVDDGVRITTSASNVQLTGNVISASTAGDGVEVSSAGSGVSIRGNLIGLGANGSTALGNRRTNVWVTNTPGVTVGGPNASDRNIISEAQVFFGVHFNASSNGIIQNNYIGTNQSGSSARPNRGESGVLVDGSSNNVQVLGNLISGNTGSGLIIRGTGINNTVVTGNIVGLNSTGADALGNGGYGIAVSGGATNVRIGTNGDGTNDLAERNVASANAFDGIAVRDAGTSSVVVAGNYLGTDVAGSLDRGNLLAGVAVFGGANNVRIGTDGSNDAFNESERNVISGNDRNGVYISGQAVSSAVVAGNYVGTTASGMNALGNGLAGVDINGGASNVQVGTNGDGVRDDTERNVIANSGTYGIYVRDSGTSNNRIAGNYIGTDATGSLDFGNTFDGIRIESGASSNTVGGLLAAQRNIISGNNINGVDIRGTNTVSNAVIGNYLGLDATGANAIGNTFNGVSVAFEANSTQVINNVSSSNGDIGIIVYFANNAVVQGNYVGLNAAGTVGRGNLGNAGILVGGAQNTLVGTNGDGVNDLAERNTVSANSQEGIQLEQNSTNTTVAGNYIGTNATGTAAIGNGFAGILLWAGANNNRIGTNGDGNSDALERNLISGNSGSGIQIEGSGTNNNRIAGNYIGTNAAGTASIPNAGVGVYMAGTASGTRIGTDGNGVADDAERNVISGNLSYGISINDAGTTNTVVAGNYVGTDASGLLDLGNKLSAVRINGSSGNTVGGSIAASRNILSGNGDTTSIFAYGVLLENGSSNNNLLGNYIGLGSDGTTAVGNQRTGVAIVASPNNTIGGTTSAARNIIGSNG